MEDWYRMTRIARVLPFVLTCGLGAQTPTAARNIVDGLNRFSGGLYGHAAKGGGNVVLSPYSVSAALSMVLAGAKGETAAEMSKVLGQAGVDPQYHAAFADLIDRITKASNTGGNEFLAANSLWVQKGFPILPEFTAQLDSAYHASPTQVDFHGDVEGARTAINQWTDAHTKGKIHELFAPGGLKVDTRLTLASAVYFNGKWEHAFRHADTQPSDFTPAQGTTEQVPFMNRKGKFGYAETAAGQTLEMHYAGTGLAFDILLPKASEPLAKLESDLTAGRLSGWLGALHERTVQASVPKFKIAYEASLGPALQSLGMRNAFTGAADFSGIDDKRDLRLSQVVHKAWVEVTEEGTEAAAATGASMALVSMVMTPDPVFKADRPFVFLIRDTKSGLILFAGRVMDPKR